ncbi:MAG: SH3 domain-containing protein [Saprospiraceae bacterium]|nr:SH3 domain-containing protein [Saprospiraceae bacterium]
MLPITKDLLTNKRNRPFLRDEKEYSIRKLKGVIAHWTANTGKGANAKANRNYFNNTDRYASAHYIVDDKTIVQCLYDNEVGYHVGANLYKADGNRIKEGSLTPNYFVIGFEMCVNKDGDWNKTYKNSVDLAAFLLRKYDFTVNDLYRHHDITGKDCPKMMLDEKAWQAFKTDIEKAMADDAQPPVSSGKVNTRELNVRSGPATTFNIVTKLAQNAIVSIFEEKNGWFRIGSGRWVSKNYIDLVFNTWLGEINSPTGANVRSGAGANFAIVDARPNKTVVHVIGQSGNWLQIGDQQYIAQSLVFPLNPKKGVVDGTNELNTRQGPGTEYRILRKLSKGDTVQIFEEQDGWLRIGHSEWVFERFIKS